MLYLLSKEGSRGEEFLFLFQHDSSGILSVNLKSGIILDRGVFILLI